MQASSSEATTEGGLINLVKNNKYVVFGLIGAIILLIVVFMYFSNKDGYASAGPAVYDLNKTLDDIESQQNSLVDL